MQKGTRGLQGPLILMAVAPRKRDTGAGSAATRSHCPEQKAWQAQPHGSLVSNRQEQHLLTQIQPPPLTPLHLETTNGKRLSSPTQSAMPGVPAAPCRLQAGADPGKFLCQQSRPCPGTERTKGTEGLA